MTFKYSNTTAASQSGYVSTNSYLNATLLTNIEIASAGAVVKNYVLNYSASPTTARETLTSVMECADSGATNCLLPTAISYQHGTVGVASPSTPSGSGSATGGFYSLDVNGDGRKDIIYSVFSSSTNTYHWYVQFASGSGYGAPVDTTLVTGQTDPVLFDDFLGNGKIDFLAPQNGYWAMVSWSGTAFVITPTTLALDTNRQPSTTNDYATADVNGDGLPDLVAVLADGAIHTRLNTSNGGTTLSFSSTTTSVGTGGLSGSLRIAGNNQFPSSSIQHLDVNGDGLDDIVFEGNFNTNCHLVSGQIVCSQAPKFIIFYANGTGFTAGATENFGGSVNQFLPLHFNDDACTDFVIPGSNAIYIAGCNGGVATTIAAPANIVAALDWDGDGHTDILANVNGTLNVYESQGTALSSGVPTGITAPSTALVVTDQNGDGLDDLAYANSAASYAIEYGIHNGADTPPDLVSSIVDGYGNSASPTYASIAQNYYSLYTTATYPYKNYIGPLYVVGVATFNDPSTTNGTFNLAYHYFGAWMNIQGRGFAGFYALASIDSRNGVYDYSNYEQTFPYTGIRFQHFLAQPDDKTWISNLQDTYSVITLDGTANNERSFPYVSTRLYQAWEAGGSENGDLIATSSTNFTYDNYGNALTINTTVTDNDPGSPYTGDTWTTNTTNTTDISLNQSTDLAAWCLNMLDETQVVYSSTINGTNYVTRTQTFAPDTPAACRVKGGVTEPTANGGLYKVTEALTFDSFGNVATDTVTGNTTAPGNTAPSSPPSRLTTLNWGATGQFLGTLTDPSGATTTTTYTSPQALTFGVPDSLKNANNLTTLWNYDGFGRKSKETRPDGTSTTWIWSACTLNCGWSNSLYQIAQTTYQTNGTTAIRTDTTSYDPVDRVAQTAGPTVTGATATMQRLYNSMGSIAQQSLPFLSGTPYQQTYGYDLLNRPLSVTRPISSTNSSPQSTAYAYAGRTLTVKDPYGNKKITITDVDGRLRQAQDALGYYVTRSYDAAESLIGITDSVGNALLKNVTVVYGIKPFVTAATDADRGAWNYTVDSFGERVGWTDAKGQTFSMTYDALSRPATRTDPITASDPGLFTQWQWGAAPSNYNVGQLIYECTATGNPTTCGTTPQYSDTRTFDSYGRLSTRAIIENGNAGNDPGGVFLFTSAYSTTTGQLNTLTYPISTSGFALKVQYGYGYGLLSSVTDTSDTTATCGTTCTLWTANAVNAFGEVTQETLGNGVVTNRSYDAVTSWLSAATAGVGGGAALLNRSYLQDENGSLIQRQDNNLGLTRSFAYDQDNRLKCSVLGSTCTTTSLIYDGGSAGPGNITTWSPLGTYAYPPPGQPQPHAVSSITGTFNGIVNPSFSYDANGNMTSRAGSSISWSSYNYPTAISASDTTGNEEVQFNYGPDRQRWEQIYSGPAGTEKTYYIGGLIDLVYTGGVANYRQYIYAGAEPVAVYSRAAAANTMSYILEDIQGSVSTILSNTGTADVNEAYSVYGARQDPVTWNALPSTQDLNTIAGLSRQGFTFQTWLGQSMGLNHMNGRVQDAIMGRFLSPDPHIPDPTNAQSYNRYSYVNNNPLTLVDPSGFDDQLPANIGGGNGGAGGGSGGNGADGDGAGLDAITVTANYIGPGGASLTAGPGLPAQGLNRIGTYTTGAMINGNFGYNASQIAGTGSGNTLDTVQVEGWALSPSQPAYTGFDFSGFPSSSAFRKAGPWLNASAIAVLVSANLMLGGGVEVVAGGRAATTTVFWNGGGAAQRVAQNYAASTGAQILRLAPGTPAAEVTAQSISQAATAAGDVVVFQTVSSTAEGALFMDVDFASSTWAEFEVPTLMGNGDVTGINFQLIDQYGNVLCSVLCPK